MQSAFRPSSDSISQPARSRNATGGFICNGGTCCYNFVNIWEKPA
jgi:hypothetical protein